MRTICDISQRLHIPYLKETLINMNHLAVMPVIDAVLVIVQTREYSTVNRRQLGSFDDLSINELEQKVKTTGP